MQWKHLKADDVGVVLFQNISSMETCVQFPASQSRSPGRNLGSSHCSSLEANPPGPSHLCGIRCDRKLLLQPVKPLLDESHGLTTVTRSSLEPWAHSSISFPQNAGLEGVPLAATILSQAAACQMEDKPSEKFTKHYSLVNWTMLAPDSCSWNLFSKKQKLWSFKRWCSLYTALYANIPPELNKTNSSLLIKSETVPH